MLDNKTTTATTIELFMVYFSIIIKNNPKFLKNRHGDFFLHGLVATEVVVLDSTPKLNIVLTPLPLP